MSQNEDARLLPIPGSKPRYTENSNSYLNETYTRTVNTTNNLTEWQTNEGIVLLNPDGTYQQGQSTPRRLTSRRQAPPKTGEEKGN